jgi:hypothetical protein
MKILFILLIASQAYSSAFESFSIGLGQYYEMPNQTEKSESEVFQFSPMLTSQMHYQWQEQLVLSPELSWVIYDPSENSSSNQNIFLLGINLDYHVIEDLVLSLGSILNINSTSGDGTEEVLPNGDGQTEYFAPNQRQNSYQLNLALGLKYLFHPYSIATRIYSYKLFNSDKREYSVAVVFNKNFQLGEK